MDRDNVFASCVGMLVSFVLVALFAAVVDGWALSTIWNWFIPRLFGLTTLTFAQAIGVALVLALFTRSSKKSESKTESKTFTEALLTSFIESSVTAVFYVTFAWIVLQFAF